MQKKKRIQVDLLRFPIESNPANVKAEVEARVNELHNDPSIESVDVVPNHTDTCFIYDIFAELR